MAREEPQHREDIHLLCCFLLLRDVLHHTCRFNMATLWRLGEQVVRLPEIGADASIDLR